MIRYDAILCRDLERGSRIEWLETNGLGGYASSTVCGVHTRRYHGLLVAATRPPAGRLLLLAKLEETVRIAAESFELSVNQYPGAIHPRGNRYLKCFQPRPFPTYLYDCGGIAIQKSIFMPHGENATVIRYQVLTPGAKCRLEIYPLIAFRDYHSTTHQNGALDPTVHQQGCAIRLAPYAGLPSLYLTHDAGEVRPTGFWYRQLEYQRERERGLDFREDLFNPCRLAADLDEHTSLTLIASTGPHPLEQARSWCMQELERRAAIRKPAPARHPFVRLLARAADQFLVERGAGTTVIAGYHWFGDWGRDTMIALPGLTLTTGRPEMARGILRAFAGSVDRGMLPNRFSESGETAEFNTVDATLWFFEAVRAYLAHTGDLDFVRTNLHHVLADIVAWHERGTRYGIRVDTDGLLAAGDPSTQLTWMDARVDGRAVTPRCGKPVEIQALWYNALKIMEDLAARLGHDGSHYRALSERAAASFRALFWNPATGCLFDVVNGQERDAAIRPNQIFAVSLPHGLLAAEQARAVVDAVEHHLLTPAGLRTLAPSDPHYRGRYDGDPRSRDEAYHQGTVWPWLMGPFVTAWLSTQGRSRESLARAAEWLGHLRRYAHTEGVGQLPELFDGDPPHQPRGCIAQAWTVGELLRVAAEVY